MKSKGRQYIPALAAAFLRESEIRSRAREHFLWTVVMVAPEPLYSLRDEVFPSFQAAFAVETGRGKSRDEIKDLSVFALLDFVLPEESSDIGSLPTYKVFRDSSLLMYGAIEKLVAWSKEFNLEGKRAKLRPKSPEAVSLARMDSVWPLVAALETVLVWHFVAGKAIETPGGVPLFRCKNFGAPPIVEDLERIQLTTVLYDPRANISKEVLAFLMPEGPPIAPPKEVNTPAWQVEWEPEPSFRARILKDFKRWLNRYVAGRKRSAQSAGLAKGPGKRELVAFIWAVKYQINEEFADVIAKEHKSYVTKHAVEKAVQGILKRIRLQPRDPMPGRRRSRSPKPLPDKSLASLSTFLRALVNAAGKSE